MPQYGACMALVPGRSLQKPRQRAIGEKTYYAGEGFNVSPLLAGAGDAVGDE